MEKQKIPGWVWMIAGIIIMGYTKLIEYKRPDTKIGYFIWVGILFLIIGIFREFVPRLLAKKEKAPLVGPPPGTDKVDPQRHASQHPAMPAHGISPHATHQHVAPTMHPSHPYSPDVKQCPRCMKHTYGHAKYCHTCGYQFF